MAVEKSPMAAETYHHNLIKRIEPGSGWRERYLQLSVLEQAKVGLVVRPISDTLACTQLMQSLRKQDIDLVAGGPPCQGFSLAGKRQPDDDRNSLPWEFLKFVEIVRPKAVLIENVSGIRNDFKKHNHSSPFDQLRMALASTLPGYHVQPLLLNALHYGVPQHRPRAFLMGLRLDVFKANGAEIVTEQVWESHKDCPERHFGPRPSLAPIRTHFSSHLDAAHLCVRDAIADLDDLGYVALGGNLSEYARQMREDTRHLCSPSPALSSMKTPKNHEPRNHSPLVVERFGLHQYLKKIGVNSNILAINKQSLTTQQQRLAILQRLPSIDYPARGEDGSVIAKDQRALLHLIRKLATKKHSQRALAWGDPSPTVLSLPDDFVHPSRPRIPTVRELARLQSFPDAFEFRSKVTTGSTNRRFEVPQYTQVGNAVPPRLAHAIGVRLMDVFAGLELLPADKLVRVTAA